MKKTLRLFYTLFLILIWSLVFCLSLELGTRVTLRTANHFYRPLFERQNAKVYQMVKLTENLKKHPSQESPYEQVPVSLNLPDESSKKTNLSENYTCKKDYELTLQGIAEIHFDKQGKITNSYGDPLIERYIHNLVQGLPINIIIILHGKLFWMQ